jgi:hypothetical protein
VLFRIQSAAIDSPRIERFFTFNFNDHPLVDAACQSRLAIDNSMLSEENALSRGTCFDHVMSKRI